MRILFTLLFLASLQPLFAQKSTMGLQQIKADVVYLASDYLEGRETGEPGEQKAAEYIAWRYRQLGLAPAGDHGSWFQEFPFFEKKAHGDNPHDLKEGIGKNVIGFLDKGADHTIVIGAHYDHLGYSGQGSLHAGEPAIHNGADDNASGIAAMFWMAKVLGDKPINNNVLFIAFSGEEKGLFGSKAFVDKPTVDLAKVNYMINMDMVGKLNEEKSLVINAVGTSPLFKENLEAIKVDDINIVTTESGIGPSDHTSFYLKDIPCLHFFTGNHKHYHKPTDDVEIVNFPGIRSVADFILDLINRLDDDGKIAFSKTKDEQKDKQVSAFKVTLGVMPDYVYQGKGMRIDGVLSDRPAENAGLKDGDIVIKMGDLEVKDIYGYMDALSKFKKGDKTKVVVLRGKDELIKKVTF